MAISTETKVGAFFLIGLVVFIVFTFQVADLGSVLHKKSTMTATFPHAGGLKKGDGVHVAGLKVGEIIDIKLLDSGIQVIMSIDAKIHIREDAIATVAWGGLIGNRYVDITLGTPDLPPLAPGSEIMSGPSIELSDVLRKIDAATTELKEMLKSSNIGPNLSTLVDNLMAISSDISEQRGTLGKLVGSDELYTEVMTIAGELKSSSSRLSNIIKENDTRISSILESLDQAAPEARDAFASIKRIGDQVESGKGILASLMNDEDMLADLKDALGTLRTTLDNVEEVANSLKEGDGLIARLAGDEQLANDFSEAIKSFKAIAQRLDTGDNTLARLTRDSDLYTDVKKLVDDARETLRSVKDQVPVGTFASVMLSAF